IIKKYNEKKINIRIKSRDSADFENTIAKIFIGNKGEDLKIIKKLIRLKIGASDVWDWDPDVAFDTVKKNANITLSNNNRTAIVVNNAGHASIIGNKGYTTGVISWRVKIN